MIFMLKTNDIFGLGALFRVNRSPTGIRFPAGLLQQREDRMQTIKILHTLL